MLTKKKKKKLPLSALWSGIFHVLADMAVGSLTETRMAKTVKPQEIHVTGERDT